MDKLNISIPIIVEGRYDKLKLESIFNAHIITTDGFGIFNKNETKHLICEIAKPYGIIILTDSDGAGLVIRNHIHSILPKEKIYDLYIPEIKGKEKRKSAPSKEGLLGVEGIDNQLLIDMFSPFTSVDKITPKGNISKTDFYNDKLSGFPQSSEKRKKLAEKLNFPTNMSSNSLLQAINLLYSKEEYSNIIKTID